MDAAAFAAHLGDDARLRFGNAEPVVGRRAIHAAISGFFETIRGLRHTIVNEWNVGEVTILELEVTYTRLDDQQVTIPGSSARRGSRSTRATS